MAVSLVEIRVKKIIHILVVAFLLLGARLFYLTLIDRETWTKGALRLMQKIVTLPATRGAITDRFGLAFAQNTIQYDVAVTYAGLRCLPRSAKEIDASGKKVRIYPRALHIQRLSTFLAKELDLDPQDVEDKIYGRAALFPHTPCVIKSNVDLDTYARLRFVERLFPGLSVQKTVARVYPKGKVGADVVGFMGSISRERFAEIEKERAELLDYLTQRERGEPVFLPSGFQTPIDVERRYLELEEKSYTVNSFVGKTGVESAFDEELRGVNGEKFYEINIGGGLVREIPGGKNVKEGQDIKLSLSLELQEFAEKLLAKNEESRLKKSEPNLPWIYGGSIVAIDPKNGEVLALASYPRFNPTDFIPFNNTAPLEKARRARVDKWLENVRHIGRIWDGKEFLEREFWDSKKGGFFIEKTPLTWDLYLSLVLGKDGPILTEMQKKKTVKEVILFFKQLEELSIVSGAGNEKVLFEALYNNKASIDGVYRPEVLEEIAKKAKSHKELFHTASRTFNALPSFHDKLLYLDLLRLFLPNQPLADNLMQVMGSIDLATFRELSQEKARLLDSLKEEAQKAFHKGAFRLWRKEHFTSFLKEKRRFEKETRAFAKPFLDYLEEEQARQFALFWEKEQLLFVLEEVLTKKQGSLYLQLAKIPTDIHLEFLSCLRTFDDMKRTLIGKYPRLRKEETIGQSEQHLASAFYPKNGFAFGSSHAFRESAPCGSTFKMVTAYAALKENRADLVLIDDLGPMTTVDKQVLGRTVSGEKILRMHKGGKLPRSAHTGIGRVDLLGALEQSSNIYFSILAAEQLKSPKSLADAARLFGFSEKSGIELPGEFAGNVPDDLLFNRTGLYSAAIGQHTLVVTPLQIAMMMTALGNGGHLYTPHIIKDKPAQLRRSLSPSLLPTLREGMRRVVAGEKGSAKRALASYPELENQIIGKTGTAEILYRGAIDEGSLASMQTHVSFGAISYPTAMRFEEPDLVVVVYLRFGRWGNQAAPLAAEMIKKWRQIKREHE